MNEETAKLRRVVKAVIIEGDSLFILKRRPNQIDKEGLWDLPGGTIEENEHPVDALIREVKEETGFDAAITGHCLKFEHPHYYKPEILLCDHYFVEIIGRRILPLLSEEHSEWASVELDDLGSYKFLNALEANKDKLLEKINARRA